MTSAKNKSITAKDKEKLLYRDNSLPLLPFVDTNTNKLNNYYIDTEENKKQYENEFKDSLFRKLKEQYKFIATCEGEQRAKLKDCYRQGGDVIVLIGPEGDFSENEVAYAEERGFRPITLGEARLRTETAALYALQGIHFINF